MGLRLRAHAFSRPRVDFEAVSDAKARRSARGARARCRSVGDAEIARSASASLSSGIARKMRDNVRILPRGSAAIAQTTSATVGERRTSESSMWRAASRLTARAMRKVACWGRGSKRRGLAGVFTRRRETKWSLQQALQAAQTHYLVYRGSVVGVAGGA